MLWERTILTSLQACFNATKESQQISFIILILLYEILPNVVHSVLQIWYLNIITFSITYIGTQLFHQQEHLPCAFYGYYSTQEKLYITLINICLYIYISGQ